jgi:hypothetical protein
VGADDVREFITRGQGAQAAVDARILETIARMNPNAARELDRLRRIEAASRAVLELPNDSAWNKLRAALRVR